MTPAQPGSPSALIVVSGNNQSAFGGAQLLQPVTFKLVDAAGIGVPSTTIFFSISAGEGLLGGATTTSATNPAGLVTAPSWTLGKLTIPQQLTASAGNISVTATAVVSTQFNAQIRFFGPPINPTYQAAFTRALNRLNAEVVGALTPVSFSNQEIASTCGVTGVAPLNKKNRQRRYLRDRRYHRGRGRNRRLVRPVFGSPIEPSDCCRHDAVQRDRAADHREQRAAE
jgi:hypothetical protein